MRARTGASAAATRARLGRMIVSGAAFVGASFALVGTTLTTVALVGCDSRFPVCKTDDDCKVKVEGSAKPPAGQRDKLCFDLRCVECRYDSDCKDGEVCATSLRECKRLDPTAPVSSAAPGEPGSGVPAGAPRDPAAWEACVKQCADKDCISKCDAKYE